MYDKMFAKILSKDEKVNILKSQILVKVNMQTRLVFSGSVTYVAG